MMWPNLLKASIRKIPLASLSQLLRKTRISRQPQSQKNCIVSKEMAEFRASLINLKISNLKIH
jgi:hypothetical protein